MSNIALIFSPRPPADYEPCVTCTAMQAVMSFAGGWYMLLGRPFHDSKGVIDVRKHPIWWQKSVRGVGVLLVGLGAYRVGELGQVAWEWFQAERAKK